MQSPDALIYLGEHVLELSAPKSQRFLRFLRLRCPSRTPEIAAISRQDKAMLHCDLRVRWKVASDLRFRAAISEPKSPSFCGIYGDLAPSTRKSLAIAIVRFWCAKPQSLKRGLQGRKRKKNHSNREENATHHRGNPHFILFRGQNPFFLQDLWRFGSVNTEIASDCDCAILVREHVLEGTQV